MWDSWGVPGVDKIWLRVGHSPSIRRSARRGTEGILTQESKMDSIIRIKYKELNL